ncbi:MAG: tyrosine-type recombinase/integrase [Candidatus Binataceae bacterium]|jgi:integrase
MASIKKFHLPNCNGGDCDCLWALDYRPLGMYGPRRRVRFKTKKAAERFLAETALQAARGEYVEPAKVPTFAEVAEDWFRSKTDRRPSHVSDLRTRLDKHLIPLFGTRRLDTIRLAEVEKLRDDLRDRGYAHRTINTILRIMGAVFKLGIKRGQCAKNPVDSVERAVQVAKELKAGEDAADASNDTVDPDNVLSPAEIQLLLRAAQPGFERVLFEAAYLTGAREGELLALRWSDLELPKEGPGKITIRRSLSWARLKGEETRPRYFPPKTKAGRRTISIAAPLVADLKRWKLQCPKSEEDLVFSSSEGKPICRDWLLRVSFYPALSRARLRRVTFHTLRHSCASAMIAAGAPVTEVQHRLGHANPAITLQVYSHFLKHTESDVADRLAEVVLGSNGSRRTEELSAAIA